MLYKSTRGDLISLKFEDVLFSGYLSDKGLAFPEKIPKLDTATLEQWMECTYPEIVTHILKLYISEDEISHKDIQCIVDQSFKKFSHPDIVPLHWLEDGELAVAEMYHGPTQSFKDLALTVVGFLLDYFLSRRNRRATILVGTSGDTGSAAIESVRKSQHMDIVVLFPKDGCVPLQELQMTTVLDPNVHCIAVEGTSDELDVPIHSCFRDVEFAKRHHLCSINSINWARILLQTAHYFYLYGRMAPRCTGKVEFIVPTGACGNLTAGLLAQEMGLPVGIVCTVNKNDILYRVQTTGEFHPASYSFHTLAVSMDIQVPYNFERILYILTQGNTQCIRNMMEHLETSKSFSLTPELRAKLKARVPVHSATDEIILSTLSRCWRRYQYHVCPHTATGLAYCFALHDSLLESEGKRSGKVVLSTASPAKFPTALERAGIPPPDSPYLESLSRLPTRAEWMREGEDWEAILRTKIESISAS